VQDHGYDIAFLFLGAVAVLPAVVFTLFVGETAPHLRTHDAAAAIAPGPLTVTELQKRALERPSKVPFVLSTVVVHLAACATTVLVTLRHILARRPDADRAAASLALIRHGLAGARPHLLPEPLLQIERQSQLWRLWLPKPARFSDAIAVRHMLFTVRCYFQVVAFGFCAPVAMVSYKTYEHLLGMSHQCAKLIHAFLQTAALVLGSVLSSLVCVLRSAVQYLSQ
jgi:hypothetical protein